jgi:type I restriction enzyme, S subunit
MSHANELPVGWIRTALSKVAAMRLGKMLDARKQDRGRRFPYLRNVNVRWHEFDLTELSTMTFSDNEIDEFTLLPGDVLICEGGEPGRSAVWQAAGSTVKFQKAIHRVRVREALLPQWLVYHLRADASAGRLENNFTGTTIKHFTGVALSEYQVRVPPINEQRRIVSKIEELQSRSRKTREAIESLPPMLEQYRRSVLSAAFRGDLTAGWREQNTEHESATALLEGLRLERRRSWERLNPNEKYMAIRPVNESELPELPRTWCWGTAEEIVDADADIVYGIVQPGPQLTRGIPYVRGCDVQDGVILVEQLLKTSPEIAQRYERASLRGGDVLLGIIRATKVAIVPKELDGANITQGTARFRPSRVITTEFLANWLDSPFAQGWLHDHYRGIDMPGLNLKDVRRLPVPLAPLAEQHALAEVLAAWKARFHGICSAVKSASTQITALDQSILAKAFRGELVPQDPNDEPANVLIERIKAERESANGHASKPAKSKRPSRAI